jgi:hypothetical protein
MNCNRSRKTLAVPGNNLHGDSGDKSLSPDLVEEGAWSATFFPFLAALKKW